ncbi:hypothetical protein AHiyo4_38180 [Arthrobacter sp. Hiyo4]|nr:hypothetical protein AHiyo4_38180 [Arthrobacter sp. Hiyo4]
MDTAKAEADLAYLARQRTAQITAITTQVRGSGVVGDGASGDDPSMVALNPALHAGGGIVNYLASGGSPMFKPSGTDTVPAMLTPGEIVIKKSSVDSIGAANLLEANRSGRLPQQGFPSQVILMVDGHQFTAYVAGVTRNELDDVSRQVGGMRR